MKLILRRNGSEYSAIGLGIKCKQCDQCFSTKSKRKAHVRKNHQNSILLHYMFGNNSLQDNSSINYVVTSGSAIVCPKCGLSFSSIVTLSRHARKACAGISETPISNVNTVVPDVWSEIRGSNSLLYLHLELGVILCKKCDTCILFDDLDSHYYSHTKSRIADEVVTYSEGVGVMVSHPNDVRIVDFYNANTREAIPWLPIYSNSYKCSYCERFTTTLPSAKQHCRTFHQMSVFQASPGHSVQTFYRKPTYLKYFSVNNSIQDQTTALERHPLELPETSPVAPASIMNIYDQSLFARVSGFSNVCDNIQVPRNDLLAILRLDENDGQIQDDIYAYLIRMNNEISAASYFIRKELLKKSRYSESTSKGMNPIMLDSSLQKYARTITKY